MINNNEDYQQFMISQLKIILNDIKYIIEINTLDN